MNDSNGAAAPSATLVSSLEPMNVVRRHVKCKRKQYDGVRAALQFLRNVLYPWMEAIGCTTAEGRLLQEPSSPCLLTKDQLSLLQELTMTGIPPTPSHMGNIAGQHVGLLKEPQWDSLLHTALTYYPLSALSKGGDGFASLYPTTRGDSVPDSPLSLWTDEVVERYVAALTAVHEDHPSRDLHAEGYLHEAGLLTRRVLAALTAGGTPNMTGENATCVEAMWASLVDAYTLFLPDRSHIHELENVPQEIGIGEVACRCLAFLGESPSENQLDLVVDVGGGNGFLAAEVAERLHCDGLVVDPHFPGHSIDCCPRIWADTPHRERPATQRRQRLSRVVGMFHETVWDRDVGVAPERCAFIAKHLCGTAIDACLAHLDQQGRLPRILVLVPCCFNKGLYAEYMNKPFLHEVLHVMDQDAYSSVARITDWNQSLYQSLLPDGPSNGSRYSPTGRDRHGQHSKRSMGHVVGCTDTLAKAVEAMLNRGRMLWLQERGYRVELCEYVPDCVTPKNKCIVACRTAY